MDLIKNRKSILKRLRTALNENDKVLFAYLFGSVVENTESSISDIDIAIYTTKRLNISEKLQLIYELGKKTKFENIDITFLNETKNLFLSDKIIRKGKVIVDKDKDFRDDFEMDIIHITIDFKFQRKLYMGV
ncbi:MAG: nucleotidyltransferase domain-containing protein [Actinomycetia bacterium]|nr:nucleotidyltransferase domain-containing protein [Actinomycetes bacterium]